jgi:hypothetical protein
MWSDKGAIMKKFKVTYYNAQKNSESSVNVMGESLEKVRAHEEAIIKTISDFNPAISLKSVEEIR